MTEKEAKPKEPEARDQCTSKHNLKGKQNVRVSHNKYKSYVIRSHMTYYH